MCVTIVEEGLYPNILCVCRCCFIVISEVLLYNVYFNIALVLREKTAKNTWERLRQFCYAFLRILCCCQEATENYVENIKT